MRHSAILGLAGNVFTQLCRWVCVCRQIEYAGSGKEVPSYKIDRNG